jgi:hypothetical protein
MRILINKSTLYSNLALELLYQIMKRQSAVTKGMELLELMQQTLIKGLLEITMKTELVLFLI